MSEVAILFNKHDLSTCLRNVLPGLPRLNIALLPTVRPDPIFLVQALPFRDKAIPVRDTIIFKMTFPHALHITLVWFLMLPAWIICGRYVNSPAMTPLQKLTMIDICL